MIRETIKENEKLMDILDQQMKNFLFQTFYIEGMY